MLQTAQQQQALSPEQLHSACAVVLEDQIAAAVHTAALHSLLSQWYTMQLLHHDFFWYELLG